MMEVVTRGQDDRERVTAPALPEPAAPVKISRAQWFWRSAVCTRQGSAVISQCLLTDQNERVFAAGWFA